jgi:hypothetical protein
VAQAERFEDWQSLGGTPKVAEKYREVARDLSCRRDHRTHEIEAVNCCRNAVQRGYFARERIHAQCLGAGSDEDGRTAVLVPGKRERELDMRSRFEWDMRMKEDSTSRHISQLAGVKIRWASLSDADLDREVNLITPCFSSLSHNDLSSMGCNSVAVSGIKCFEIDNTWLTRTDSQRGAQTLQ